MTIIRKNVCMCIDLIIIVTNNSTSFLVSFLRWYAWYSIAQLILIISKIMKFIHFPFLCVCVCVCTVLNRLPGCIIVCHCPTQTIITRIVLLILTIEIVLKKYDP